MFARIARRYDLANRILSGGVDRLWRRRLVAAVRRAHPQMVLDLATGSGDVAFALGRGLPAGVQIIGMDFCQPMLDEAEAKKRRAGGYSNVSFRPGDGLALPLADASFDAVTIAFGLRNMADRPRAIGEMRRVLRPPQGRLFVLEFSQPSPWIRPFYYWYLQRLLPRLAGRITGDRAAYEYLGRTIGDFPDRDRLCAEFHAAGFSTVTAIGLSFGIVALHEAAA
jgi:demethylmenaquinone methyltransferase/2-methoxy-6-polyprenyl-1,4-benzoquinol methylase